MEIKTIGYICLQKIGRTFKARCNNGSVLITSAPAKEYTEPQAKNDFAAVVKAVALIDKVRNAVSKVNKLGWTFLRYVNVCRAKMALRLFRYSLPREIRISLF